MRLKYERFRGHWPDAGGGRDEAPPHKKPKMICGYLPGAMVRYVVRPRDLTSASDPCILTSYENSS